MVGFQGPPVRRYFWRDSLFLDLGPRTQPQHPQRLPIPQASQAGGLLKGPAAGLRLCGVGRPWEVWFWGGLRGWEDSKHGKSWQLNSWVPGGIEPSWTALSPPPEKSRPRGGTAERQWGPGRSPPRTDATRAPPTGLSGFRRTAALRGPGSGFLQRCGFQR